MEVRDFMRSLVKLQTIIKVGKKKISDGKHMLLILKTRKIHE